MHQSTLALVRVVILACLLPGPRADSLPPATRSQSVASPVSPAGNTRNTSGSRGRAATPLAQSTSSDTSQPPSLTLWQKVLERVPDGIVGLGVALIGAIAGQLLGVWKALWALARRFIGYRRRWK